MVGVIVLCNFYIGISKTNSTQKANDEIILCWVDSNKIRDERKKRFCYLTIEISALSKAMWWDLERQVGDPKPLQEDSLVSVIVRQIILVA